MRQYDINKNLLKLVEAQHHQTNIFAAEHTDTTNFAWISDASQLLYEERSYFQILVDKGFICDMRTASWINISGQ